MYEYLSKDPLNISEYVKSLLENKKDDEISMKISALEKDGETFYGVDSCYKGDLDSVIEYRSIDYRNIKNYLETRIRDNMNSLEISAYDGFYDVATIKD